MTVVMRPLLFNGLPSAAYQFATVVPASPSPLLLSRHDIERHHEGEAQCKADSR